MTPAHFITAYLVVGSAIPLVFLAADSESVGFARLSAGLEDDNRYLLGMFLAGLLWPIVIAWLVLLQLGIIKRDW